MTCKQDVADIVIKLQPVGPHQACTETLSSLNEQQLAALRAFIGTVRDMSLSFETSDEAADVRFTIC